MKIDDNSIDKFSQEIIEEALKMEKIDFILVELAQAYQLLLSIIRDIPAETVSTFGKIATIDPNSFKICDEHTIKEEVFKLISAHARAITYLSTYHQTTKHLK